MVKIRGGVKIRSGKILVKPENVKPSSDKYKVIGVLNPAAIRMPDNKIVLYVRVIEKLKDYRDNDYFYSPRCIGKDECKLILDKFDKKDVVDSTSLDFLFKDETKRLTFISHLRRVVLDESGMRVLSIDKKPSFYGISNDGELGVEDARITKIDNKYYMTYVSLSRNMNISTGLAVSNDCKTWTRKGIIFAEQNKDVVLFPEKINGLYVAYNRPEGNFEFSLPHVWLSFSKDLQYWGTPKVLKLGKKGAWDAGRVGAGPPPIKTKDGWLFIYHGVEAPEKGGIFARIFRRLFGSLKEDKASYSAGATLIDLKDPARVLAKANKPIIEPTEKYEKDNFVHKEVVFPTGAVMDLNGRDLLIYSGGGDTVTTVKRIKLSDIMDDMEKVNGR